MRGLERGYERSLNVALKGRVLVLLLAAVVAGTSAFFYLNLRSELAPPEDRGALRVRGLAPEGATLAYTGRYSRQVGDILSDFPEVRAQLVIDGIREPSQFLVIAPLVDWDERERTQQQLMAEITPKLPRIVGVQAVTNQQGAFGQRGSGKPVEFVIQTSGTYEQLQEYSDKILERAREYPGLEGLDTDLKLNAPEFRVEINRAKAADLGLDVTLVGRTLETLLGGRQVTRFEQNGEQYDVYVQLAEEDRASPATLATIFVRTPRGEMVALSNLVTVEESVAPKELKRFNQLRSVTITANLAPGYALGDGLAFLEQAAREVLPANVQTDVAGESRDFRAAGQSLAVVFVLALGFIYLVLSAQFESFRDPLNIMLTVPLSMTGALGALWLAGGTLNLYSQIGLVTLVGLITKHGILIVEFANQQQAPGRARRDAIIMPPGCDCVRS